MFDPVFDAKQTSLLVFQEIVFSLSFERRKFIYLKREVPSTYGLRSLVSADM